jgi:hypothetical protein
VVARVKLDQFDFLSTPEVDTEKLVRSDAGN